MTTLDTLLQRNTAFALRQSAALPRALPNAKALIIGCADMRVDPAHVLGIEPGEAVVIRNIGGRVTPGTLAMIGLLGRIAQVAGASPGAGGAFDLIVLHHTDCGITRLTGDPDLLSQYFHIGKADLNAKAVPDPRAAVAVDVAALKAVPALPGEWLVSGLVHNVTTGLVDIIVPPAPLHGRDAPHGLLAESLARVRRGTADILLLLLGRSGRRHGALVPLPQDEHVVHPTGADGLDQLGLAARLAFRG